MKKLTGLLGGALLIGSLSAHAGNLVYQPINPSFGGNPLYGNYLLGKAQAQDTYEDPDIESYEPLSATERLVSRLESQLLSDMINDVREEGNGITEGFFESGDYSVIIDGVGGELNLQVTDKATGDVTTIDVGNFNP